MFSQNKTLFSIEDERIAEIGFFQFLRMIQIESGRPIGLEKQIEKQAIKIVPEIDPAFPTNELTRLEPPSESGGRHTLHVAFQGLFGAQGVLPDHYTQTIIERLRHKDHSLLEFLNIFNNRLITLFYRAWEKHILPVSVECSAFTDNNSSVEQAMLALIGNRLRSSQERLSIPDSDIIHYAGLFSSGAATQSGLECLVSDYTGILCQVEPLVGQWHTIATEDQTKISISSLGSVFCNSLGINTVLGDRVWDCENRFRLRLGPCRWEVLMDYLPVHRSLRHLFDLTRRYVGLEWEFDVQIAVEPNTMKGIKLSGDDAFYLGWNSWLGEWEDSKPAEDAIFELSEC